MILNPDPFILAENVNLKVENARLLERVRLLEAVVDIANKIQISHFDGDGNLYVHIDALVLRLEKLRKKVSEHVR